MAYFFIKLYSGRNLLRGMPCIWLSLNQQCLEIKYMNEIIFQLFIIQYLHMQCLLDATD